MNKTITKTRGFTLIEVLIVIGIIAILAAIVLVAVNPAKNFRNAANTQRSANVNAIINAIGQYAVDNKGVMDGLKLPANGVGPIAISATGMNGGNNGTFATFCNVLVPAFIGALPSDPNKTPQSITGGTGGAAGTCSDTSADTGYQIAVDSNGHITISAPSSVNPNTGGSSGAPTIQVTR